jgi:hypothetical protein
MKSLNIIICISLLLSCAFKSHAKQPTLVINNPAAVCFPATVNLTSSALTAGSSPGLTYSYWLNDSATINYSTPATATTGKYYIKGTDLSGESSISPVIVTVDSLLTPKVSITSNVGINICAGNTVSFTAITENGGHATYQWRKGTTNITGATSNTYTTSNLANGNAINVVMTVHDICATSTSVTSNTITMIVNPIVVPSIMISVLNNNVCTGITYAAVITNGGGTPSYQWQLNGVNIPDANSDTYTASSLNNGDFITCTLTSNALCANPVSVVSNKLKVNLTVPTTTWLGNDNNFNSEANWSNGIPNADLSAIIRSNTLYSPVIYTDATVYNLLIQDGAILTINGANNLTIYGSLTNNGTFNANYSAVIFAGCRGTAPFTHGISTTNKVITTFFTLCLNDVAGLNQNSDIALAGSFKLINGAFKNNDKNFTLLSTKEATAYMPSVSTTASYVGNITMQRFVPGPITGWTTFGSAVNGATLEQWEDNFPKVDTISSYLELDGFKAVFTYNENAPGPFDTLDTYICPTNNKHQINTGVGFMAYLGNGSDTADITIALSGKPTIGDFDFKPTYTDSKNAFDGFNLIANPYPCTIDWNSNAWTKLNINEAIYTNLANNSQYASYVNGVGINGGSPYIASSQGFYVQAADTMPVLIASENVKSNRQTGLGQSGQVELSDKLIRIKLDGLSYVDEAVIRFNEKASDKFDKNYDAYKLLSPDKERPSIATIANNQSFGINTMPLAGSLKIPVKVNVSKAGTYSFNFEGLESFPSNYCVVLEDLFTHVKTDLMHTKTYSFEMSDTTNAPRFIMHLIAPLEVCASAANAGVGSDGTIKIIGGNDSWLYELRNSKNELVSAGKANDESKLLSDLKADDYVLYLDNGMGNTNMSVPVSVGTKTTPVSFENNNTVFIEKGEAHVNLTDTTSFGDSYIWDFGDGSTLGTIQPNATHTYTKDGRYQVTITSNKGANKIVKNLVIDVFDAPSRKKAMDIQNINGEYYAVFKFEKTTQVTLQITNLDGQIVAAPMLIEGMVGCQKIDIPTLQKGNNIICLSDGKNKLTKKILQK